MAATMKTVSREHLRAFLDDALSDAETAELEHLLRSDENLRQQLRSAVQERDRGDHSVGAIWRQERLTCPSREQLGSYLLEVLDQSQHGYIEFHLNVIACSFCQANLDDIKDHQKPAQQTTQRRRKYYQSSAGLLNQR